MKKLLIINVLILITVIISTLNLQKKHTLLKKNNIINENINPVILEPGMKAMFYNDTVEFRFG